MLPCSVAGLRSVFFPSHSALNLPMWTWTVVTSTLTSSLRLSWLKVAKSLTVLFYFLHVQLQSLKAVRFSVWRRESEAFLLFFFLPSSVFYQLYVNDAFRDVNSRDNLRAVTLQTGARESS